MTDEQGLLISGEKLDSEVADGDSKSSSEFSAHLKAKSTNSILN